eukprot:m.18563 g.18563  ORF g.18563 m.18563 type:complete len:72 (-) comp8327_c0_seq3:1874-2089(-)
MCRKTNGDASESAILKFCDKMALQHGMQESPEVTSKTTHLPRHQHCYINTKTIAFFFSSFEHPYLSESLTM